jgi:hypothetical protein
VVVKVLPFWNVPMCTCLTPESQAKSTKTSFATLTATIDTNVHWDQTYNIRTSDASNIPTITRIGVLIDTRRIFTLILKTQKF